MSLNVPHRKQSGLNDQPIHDKENIPPSSGSQEPIIKQRKVNRSNHISTRSKWSTYALEEAMDVVERNTTSLKKASRHWNIPLPLMFDHFMEKQNVNKQD
jgi:hypothetical protein